MRSDLRALRERIRQVEAGGRRDTPLRRAYNRKLREHRTLRGLTSKTRAAVLQAEGDSHMRHTPLHQASNTLRRTYSSRAALVGGGGGFDGLSEANPHQMSLEGVNFPHTPYTYCAGEWDMRNDKTYQFVRKVESYITDFNGWTDDTSLKLPDDM